MCTRPGRLALAPALAVLAVSGCGSTSASPKLSSSEAAALRMGLASIRAAQSAHDRGRARLALDRVSHLVAGDAAAGDLAPADLQALRSGISQARRRITLDVSSAATPTTPTTTAPAVATSTTTVTSAPAPPTPAPKEKHPKAKGHGHSKEHGHGKGAH